LTESDGANDTTKYDYDGVDRVVLLTDPAIRRVGTVYDAAGQTLCTWRGWNSATAPTQGTPWTPPASYAGTGPVRYAAYTYYPNGKQQTVADANNNLSTYTYDGFDRLQKLSFPATTSGSMTSSTTDYEFYDYDKSDNRISLRKRDGQTIA